MDCIFEAYVGGRDSAPARLIHRFTESCAVDDIAHHAARTLWSIPLPERQDLVIVRDAHTGQEIMRRTMRGLRHWTGMPQIDF